MDHLIESQQLDLSLIKDLFNLADRLENNPSPSLKGKIMACLFYEPSTRTRFSFESAMIRLGGGVISTENARDFSSAAKGETLEDTIRVAGSYADVIVLRHFEQGSARRAASVSKVPIINAGDGAGQHPTQALLDLYTIQCELGRTDNFSITFVGDLKNGRTVRSLAYLLGKCQNIQVRFVSPPALQIGSDIKTYLDDHGIEYQESQEMEPAIGQADVVYQTRIQKERFTDQEEYERFQGIYIIDSSVAKKMKPGAIIMHPLPRVGEITLEVDDLPNAAYFRQAYYGLLIRMALLEFLLN